MTLRCHLFGHLRSRSHATFDEKHGHWLSECKRCHMLLVRDPEGKWRPLPPPPGRLVPIERSGDESAAPGGSDPEAPAASSGAQDAANGRAAPLDEGVDQSLELAAS